MTTDLDDLQRKKELVEKLIMEATPQKWSELGRVLAGDVKLRLDPLFRPLGITRDLKEEEEG